MTTEIQCIDKFDNEYQIISMNSIPEYNKEDYDLGNEKEFKKYLFDIEKCVRTSREYNKFILYLRNYMDMNKCAFFQHVTNLDTTKIKIELHHHPFTLYEIALIIFRKRRHFNESLEVELVAKEVMYIHYFLYVGLVPLAQTIHELVHEQLLFVPLDIVLGNYQKFINLYDPFLEDFHDKIRMYEDMTKAYNSSSNLALLKVTPVYLQFPHDIDPNTYSLPRLQDMLNNIGEKLLEIKENKPKGLIVDTSAYDNNPTKEKISPFTIISQELNVPFTIS